MLKKIRRFLFSFLLSFFASSIGCISFINFFACVFYENRLPTKFIDFFNFNFKHPFLVFLLILIVSVCLLLVIYLLCFNVYKFKEKNIEIMPNIFIPEPIKKKSQYGTSWFLEKEKFKETFSYNTLEKNKLVELLLNNKPVPEAVYEKYKFSGGGLTLGLSKEKGKEVIFYNNDDTHSIVLGATRSGKGRTVLLQTIANQTLAGENIICSDPKGELYIFTKEFLENLGYEVIALDFEEPEKSNSFNFLQNVIDYVNENDITRAMDSVEDIVDMLVVKGGNTEPIWENGEKSILAFAILLVVIENKDKPEYQNLTTVYNFLSQMCVSDEKGNIPLNKYIKDLDDDHPAKLKASISLVAPERTRGSFFTSALSTLRLFSNPFIYEMSKKTDFDIGDSDKKRAIFIILPDQKETYNSLGGLFISQYYNSLIKNAKANGNRLKRRVNFNLDEFGNFPAINGMESKMTVSAGYGIRFNLFIQSFAQFQKVYSEETSRTLKDNAETLVYLKSVDPATLEEMSKNLGTYTCLNATESDSKSGLSSSTQYIQRPLLTDNEIKKINRPYTLIIKSGHNCIFNSPDLSQWSFNKMYGLGDKEHNQRVIQQRQDARVRKESKDIKIPIWDVLEKDYKEIESAISGISKFSRKK